MSDTLPHYVRREPFDAYDGEKTDPSLESYYQTCILDRRPGCL
jgi:hypothetical protein